MREVMLKAYLFICSSKIILLVSWTERKYLLCLVKFLLSFFHSKHFHRENRSFLRHTNWYAFKIKHLMSFFQSEITFTNTRTHVHTDILRMYTLAYTEIIYSSYLISVESHKHAFDIYQVGMEISFWIIIKL